MGAPTLTALSPGGGCGCKMPQDALASVLAGLRPRTAGAPDLLVALDPADDAAVVELTPGRGTVLTCDFMTPIVDDPYDWGRIAASNALSDVYAMGGRPLVALNLVCWPSHLPRADLARVLDGGAQALVDSGSALVGGHSIVDPVPKYGLAVVGEVALDRLMTKGGGSDGDALVLTKALGIGVVGTAIKQGRAPHAVIDAAVATMVRANRSAAEVAGDAGVRGGTDVTGFGLIGHLHELARASGLAASVDANSVPLLAGVRELVGAGCVPDGTRRTLRASVEEGWLTSDAVSEATQLLLADAQTSGGLLLCVPSRAAPGVRDRIRSMGDPDACIVGRLHRGARPGAVHVA